MIYLKWFILASVDILLLLTIPLATPFVSLFTKAQPYGELTYNWGGWWGTYDNPPQGDEGFVKKRSLFPGITTGFKGYINRCHWIIRNPLYGYSRLVSVNYPKHARIVCIGKENISDKEKIPGWYFAKVWDKDELVAFEFYMVKPWSATKDLRVRLGWKVMTSKFKERGFAPLVNTFNPLDGYGNT